MAFCEKHGWESNEHPCWHCDKEAGYPREPARPRKRPPPPPKKANPVEHLYCHHCDSFGMRYQGTRTRKRGLSRIYKCANPECRRDVSNPLAEKPEGDIGIRIRHATCHTMVTVQSVLFDGGRKMYRGPCEACKKYVVVKSEPIAEDEKAAKYHEMGVKMFRRWKWVNALPTHRPGLRLDV